MDKRRLFTSKEKEFLKQLVLQYSDVIENKRSDGSNNKKKNEAWTLIQQEFNSIGDHSQRSVKQLKKLWDNIKTERKKELAAAKKERFMTGGGPPPTQDPTQDPTDAIFAFAEEIEGAIDSDTVALSNVGETTEFELVEVVDKVPPEVDNEPAFEKKEVSRSKKRKQSDMVRDELHEKVKRARTLNEHQETIHQLMKEKLQNEMELARVKIESVKQEMRQSDEIFMFEMSQKEQEANQRKEAFYLDLAQKKQAMEQAEKSFLSEMSHRERKWEIELEILKKQLH